MFIYILLFLFISIAFIIGKKNSNNQQNDYSQFDEQRVSLREFFVANEEIFINISSSINEAIDIGKSSFPNDVSSIENTGLKEDIKFLLDNKIKRIYNKSNRLYFQIDTPNGQSDFFIIQTNEKKQNLNNSFGKKQVAVLNDNWYLVEAIKE